MHVQSKQGPTLLWRIALDVLLQALPFHATGYFIKQRDWCTSRSSLTLVVMEILQVLKYISETNHLSFTKWLLCSEEDLSVMIFSETVEKATFDGQENELKDLLDSSWRAGGRAGQLTCLMHHSLGYTNIWIFYHTNIQWRILLFNLFVSAAS